MHARARERIRRKFEAMTIGHEDRKMDEVARDSGHGVVHRTPAITIGLEGWRADAMRGPPGDRMAGQLVHGIDGEAEETIGHGLASAPGQAVIGPSRVRLPSTSGRDEPEPFRHTEEERRRADKVLSRPMPPGSQPRGLAVWINGAMRTRASSQ